MIILGIALIAVVLFMPSGLWGGVESLIKRWKERRSGGSEKATKEAEAK